MGGKIYVGVGGWSYEPWRGEFYPNRLKQKDELCFISSNLTSIENQCGVKHYVSVV